MRKACSALLSLMLALTLSVFATPVALAVETPDVKPESKLHGTEMQSDSSMSSDTVSDEIAADLVSNGDDTPSDDALPFDGEVSNGENEFAGEMPASSEEISSFSVVGGQYVYQVDLEQQGESTVVGVTFPNIATLVETSKVDRVVVEGTMSYHGETTRQIVAEKSMLALSEVGYTFPLDFATYGKFSVTAKFYKGEDLVGTGDTQTLGVTADEYNLAPISGSFPVLLFSLSLWDVSSDGNGGTIPTIVMLERTTAYNWDNLPSSMYPMPYIDEAEIGLASGDTHSLFNQRSDIFASYVKDLYELNPSAKFNLYINDFHAGLAHSVIYANGIPEDQSTITFLQDGTFSYNMFNSNYGVPNPQSVNDSLIAAWNNAKEAAYSLGEVSPGFAYANPRYSVYAVVSNTPNAAWWITRNDQFSSGDENVFALQAKNMVTTKNLGDLFKALSNKGDAVVQDFKALYNFSDEYFSASDLSGKKSMLVLGTRVSSETDFDEYVRFTQAYYGNEYVYYYKGHPATPTDLYPSKQEQLDRLGMIDIDSSIAAEIILFFYPDISLSGYSTSTFLSASFEMAGGLYGKTKAQALADPTCDYTIMDWFISPMSSANAEIKSLCPSLDTSYLVEFSDAVLESADYDIAIWNDVDESISYYRQDNGSYVLVRTQGGSGEAYDIRTLSSKLDGAKVVDVYGGYTDNKANVRLYGNNRSAAQRYRFIDAGDGYYVIQNVNSEKVLDVAGASTENGANVWQYEWNDSDAQKWKLLPVEGEEGMYNLVSKCNGLYLDVFDAQTANGTNIHVWEGNGTDAQIFRLSSVQAVIEDGVHRLETALPEGTGLVLDVYGASMSNGGNIQIWERNGTVAQDFVFSYDKSTGYYTIANTNSEKVLDVCGGDSAPGTNVWQYENNGTNAQKWSIEQTKDSMGNPCYEIYSAAGGGCCLDVAGADASKGTNVWAYAHNGSDAQKWRL